MPGTESVASGRKFSGNPVTARSPSSTYASPRYSPSVPMVTASEGSPNRTISTAFTEPSTTPATITIGTIVSNDMPASHSVPVSAEQNPSIDATDRSISPVRTIGSSANASSATSL